MQGTSPEVELVMKVLARVSKTLFGTKLLVRIVCVAFGASHVMCACVLCVFSRLR